MSPSCFASAKFVCTKRARCPFSTISVSKLTVASVNPRDKKSICTASKVLGNISASRAWMLIRVGKSGFCVLVFGVSFWTTEVVVV